MAKMANPDKKPSVQRRHIRTRRYAQADVLEKRCMARTFRLTSPEWQYDESQDKVVCVGDKDDFAQIQEYADCNYKTQLSRIRAAIPYLGFDVDEEDIDDDTQDIQAVANRYMNERTAKMWQVEQNNEKGVKNNEKPQTLESQEVGETLPQHG